MPALFFHSIPFLILPLFDDLSVLIGEAGKVGAGESRQQSSRASQPAEPAESRSQQGHNGMQGWLTKKGRVTWKRRWFVLQGHTLSYYPKKGDAKPRGQMLLNAEVRGLS